MKFCLRHIVLFFLALVAFSCSRIEKQQNHISFSFGPKVDSLLHDTTQVNYVVDSLKQEAIKANYDTALINILNELAQMYDKYGLAFTDETLRQSQKLDYKYGITDAICRRGIYYFKRDKFDSSTANLERGLAMAEKNKEQKLIATAIFFKGEICRIQSDYKKAFAYYHIADSIALKTGDIYRMAVCRTVIGDIYRHKNQYDTALVYYNQSVKLADSIRLRSQLAFTLESMGDVYRLQNNYVTALQYYTRALDLAKQLRSKLRLAGCYSVIGDVYHLQHDTVNAMLYFNKAIPLAKEIGDKSDMIFCLSIMGDTYMENGKYDNALKNYTEAMELSKKISSKNYISFLLSALAGVYMAKSDYAQALDYYNQAIDMAKDLGDKNYEAQTDLGLGELYFKEKEYAKAKEYAVQSLASAKAANSLQNIANAAELACKVAKQTNDYGNALAMHILYVAMHDSVNSRDMQKQEVQKEFQYEYDKKDAELKADQERKQLIAQAESKRERIAALLALLVAVFTVIIAVLVFRSLRITRKQKLIIEDQKLLVEQKNKDVLDSITYAKRLQDAILPPLNTVKKYLPESFVLYKPKDIVAGDFYWLEKSNDAILIAACDSTGHGVPGAMVSVVCSTALNSAVKEFHITEPGKVLDKTRELLIETFEKSESEVNDGMDVSLASLTPSEGGIKLQWAGANNPLWYVQDNVMKEINPDKQPIGNYEITKPFTTHTIKLKKGDTLYLFTDGYADQFGGPKGKKFKYKQLQEKILAVSHQSMSEQKQILEATLAEWKGSLEQVDDVLIIGIRV